MTFNLLYDLLIETSKESKKGITAAKAFKISIQLLKDEAQAIKFLTSEKGGYTLGQINRARYKRC